LAVVVATLRLSVYADAHAEKLLKEAINNARRSATELGDRRTRNSSRTIRYFRSGINALLDIARRVNVARDFTVLMNMQIPELDGLGSAREICALD
jgi:hypothetical protein